MYPYRTSCSRSSPPPPKHCDDKMPLAVSVGQQKYFSRFQSPKVRLLSVVLLSRSNHHDLAKLQLRSGIRNPGYSCQAESVALAPISRDLPTFAGHSFEISAIWDISNGVGQRAFDMCKRH